MEITFDFIAQIPSNIQVFQNTEVLQLNPWSFLCYKQKKFIPFGNNWKNCNRALVKIISIFGYQKLTSLVNKVSPFAHSMILIMWMALVSAVILGIFHNTTTHYLIIIHPFYFFNASPEISSAYVISFIGIYSLQEK